MSPAAAIVGVGGERQEREVLSIKIVFQIEHARETSPGDLRFRPRAIGVLRAQEEAQPALNAKTIEIAAGTDAHYRPGCLRRGALSDPFDSGIFISGTRFTPAAIRVLAAFQPVAPAQDPVLSHVLTDRTQAAQNLPRAVDIIDTPSPVPGAIVLLRVDQILYSLTHAS